MQEYVTNKVLCPTENKKQLLKIFIWPLFHELHLTEADGFLKGM